MINGIVLLNGKISSEVGLFLTIEIIDHFEADIYVTGDNGQAVGIVFQWGEHADGVWDGYQFSLKLMNQSFYATLGRFDLPP
jgi:hypothetical protein